MNNNYTQTSNNSTAVEEKPKKEDLLLPEGIAHPWFNATRNTLYEMEYARDFMERWDIIYTEGAFYDSKGIISEEEIEMEIFNDFGRVNVQTNLDRRTKSLLNALRRYFNRASPFLEGQIDVRNGSVFLSTDKADCVFFEQMLYSKYRYKFEYKADCESPERWIKFLNELLEPDDVLTLQEYIGYCLVDSTKAQSMLFIVGKGGEGKSQIGRVLAKIFENSAYFVSIKDLTEDKFLKANLVGKRLVIDDDMNFAALRDTSFLKTLASSETPLTVQEKGKQSVQVNLKCRTIGFSNSAPKSLYDKSYGWTRRLIILTTKNTPAGREIDPYFGDKLCEESEKIFNWALKGLQRLVRNKYKFTISEKAKQNVKELQEENCNIMEFLKDPQIVSYGEECRTTSQELYTAYNIWCKENSQIPLKSETFNSWIRQNQDDYGIIYSKNVWNKPKYLRARGYFGIQTTLDF